MYIPTAFFYSKQEIVCYTFFEENNILSELFWEGRVAGELELDAVVSAVAVVVVLVGVGAVTSVYSLALKTIKFFVIQSALFGEPGLASFLCR